MNANGENLTQRRKGAKVKTDELRMNQPSRKVMAGELRITRMGRIWNGHTGETASGGNIFSVAHSALNAF
jgi:hypothetical protein